jgi:hypothetical protein
MERSYTVSELKSLIREASSNEFKAKLGPEVKSKNKEINDKAYKDAESISKEHYGKELEAPEIAKYQKRDWNKTTLDADFDFEPDKKWKEEQKAHAEGYSSVDEKENNIEKTGDRKGNEDFYKASKETDDKIKTNKEIINSTGIKSNAMYNRPGGKEYFKREGAYVNENKVKTVFFKKTTFLTEAHMISRIPDEFKNEGCTFKMKDKTGNEYLVEWSDNRPNIIGHEDNVRFNESLERMKNLFNYNSGDYYKNTTGSERLNESNDGFTTTLNNARKIIK